MSYYNMWTIDAKWTLTAGYDFCKSYVNHNSSEFIIVANSFVWMYFKCLWWWWCGGLIAVLIKWILKRKSLNRNLIAYVDTDWNSVSVKGYFWDRHPNKTKKNQWKYCFVWIQNTGKNDELVPQLLYPWCRKGQM